jgi:hypothetical protein
MDGSLQTAKHLAPGYATPSLGGVTGSTRLAGPSLVTKRRCRKPTQAAGQRDGAAESCRPDRRSCRTPNPEASTTHATRERAAPPPLIVHTYRGGHCPVCVQPPPFSCSDFGRSHQGRRPGVSAPWARHVPPYEAVCGSFSVDPTHLVPLPCGGIPKLRCVCVGHGCIGRLANDLYGLEAACRVSCGGIHKTGQCVGMAALPLLRERVRESRAPLRGVGMRAR